MSFGPNKDIVFTPNDFNIICTSQVRFRNNDTFFRYLNGNKFHIRNPFSKTAYM